MDIPPEYEELLDAIGEANSKLQAFAVIQNFVDEEFHKRLSSQGRVDLVYMNYFDACNYERLRLEYRGYEVWVSSEAAGTGIKRTLKCGPLESTQKTLEALAPIAQIDPTVLDTIDTK